MLGYDADMMTVKYSRGFESLLATWYRDIGIVELFWLVRRHVFQRVSLLVSTLRPGMET